MRSETRHAEVQVNGLWTQHPAREKPKPDSPEPTTRASRKPEKRKTPSERAALCVSADIASRLVHNEAVVRQAAVAALGALGDIAGDQAGHLAKLLQDRDAGVRKAAAIALGNLGQSAAEHSDVS